MDELEEYKLIVSELKQLHSRVDCDQGVVMCAECGSEYPCWTLKIIAAGGPVSDE